MHEELALGSQKSLKIISPIDLRYLEKSLDFEGVEK